MVGAPSRGRPWDLVLALAYTATVGVFILSSGEGSPWAILFLLFTPGYILMALLFPGRGLAARLQRLIDEGERIRVAARRAGADLEEFRETLSAAHDAVENGRLVDAIRLLEEANDRLLTQMAEVAGRRRGRRGKLVETRPDGEIDWVERLTFSFGLSIAIVTLLGLLLTATSALGLAALTLSVLAFTLAAGAAALWRRLKLPAQERLTVSLPTRIGGPGRTGLDRVLGALLVASVVFAASTFVYILVAPRPADVYTEFYLLGADGTANPDAYPTRLNVSATGVVTIGIANRESTAMVYTVRIDLVGIALALNVSSGLLEPVPVNRTTIATFGVPVPVGTVWERPYTFAIREIGFWDLEFFLLRPGDGDVPYRILSLPVEIVPNG